MKKILFIIAIIVLSQDVFCQEVEIIAKLYMTSQDFINKDTINVNAIVVLKGQSPQHLWVKKIINANTRKKIDRDVSVWAIEYKNQYFFNLGYSNDINKWKVFVKLDIIGKYCATFINKESPPIVKNGGPNYGGGLQGVLISESTKWNKDWIDTKGIKQRILFINTSKIINGYASRNNSSLGNYLTRQELKEICPDNLKITELSFEQVVEIINRLNNESLVHKQ